MDSKLYFDALTSSGRSQPSYHLDLFFFFCLVIKLLFPSPRAAWATLTANLLHQQVFGTWFLALDF